MSLYKRVLDYLNTATRDYFDGLHDDGTTGLDIPCIDDNCPCHDRCSDDDFTGTDVDHRSPDYD